MGIRVRRIKNYMFENTEKMQSFTDGYAISELQLDNALSEVLRRVYGLMAGGLLLTAAVAWFVMQSGLIYTIVANRPLFFGLMIAELALVFGISGAINRLNPMTTMALFLFYSALNGATMAAIFLAYTYSSIAMVFAITATMFGAMSLVGFTTKTNMSKFGSYFFMGLIGFIVASIANIWIGSSILYWGLTYFGVALFLGLTIYDTQRIKEMTLSAAMQNGGTVEGSLAWRIAVSGALALYLDFVNLFLLLLRIFGGSRD